MKLKASGNSRRLSARGGVGKTVGGSLQNPGGFHTEEEDRQAGREDNDIPGHGALGVTEIDSHRACGC